MNKFYIFFAIVITVIFQFFIFKIIGFGKVSDTFFLSSTISQFIILLTISSIQNSWLNTLILDSSESILHKFAFDTSKIIYLALIIQLISLISFFTFFDFSNYSLNYYLIFSLIYLVSNFFQLLTFRFNIYFYSQKKHIIVERIEFFSVLIYVISFIIVVHFKQFLLLPLPQLVKYFFQFLYFKFFHKLNFNLHLNKNIFNFKFNSNLLHFFLLSSPGKSTPMIDRTIIGSYGISYLSIFSICDSAVSTMSRFFWQSYGFPKISNYMYHNDKKKHKIFFFNTFIISTILVIITGLMINSNFFNIFLLKYNYFQLNSFQFEFLKLAFLALLPTLYFTIPLGLIQNYLISAGIERFVINVNLTTVMLFLITKLIFMNYVSVNTFIIIIFSQKILEYVISYVMITKKVKFIAD
jgi:hypothetical protein